jgi:hypothetical protein
MLVIPIIALILGQGYIIVIHLSHKYHLNIPVKKQMDVMLVICWGSKY